MSNMKTVLATIAGTTVGLIILAFAAIGALCVCSFLGYVLFGGGSG